VVLLGRRWPRPVRWDGIVSLQFMILLVPAMPRIIVHENTGIPTTIEAFGSAMEAFRRLIEEDIAGGKNDFVRISVEVL